MKITCKSAKSLWKNIEQIVNNKKEIEIVGYQFQNDKLDGVTISPK